MRPLEHLGVGPSSKDYQFFEMDEKSYDNCMERAEKLINEAFEKFMGAYIDKPPKPTFKELKEEYNNRLQRLKRLNELHAPKTIIEHEEQIAVDLENKMRKKDFSSKSDPAYAKYRAAYEQRVAEWESSEIKKNLLKEIRKYNENEFSLSKTKIKAQKEKN
jgi:hypothetical protein